MVGLAGFEPATSPLSGVRSNQLSYRPKQKKAVSIWGSDKYFLVACRYCFRGGVLYAIDAV